MPYTFTCTTIIPASAQEIYEAWLDSLTHSEMTSREASMSDEIGAEVSAWDGHITGRNLELVPGERIVQSWRTTQFADDHADSIITVTLEEVKGGTLLTLMHSNVPDGHTSYEQGGWQEHYFEPMKDFFANRTPTGISAKSKAAAPKTKRAAKRTTVKHAAKTETAAPGRKKRKSAVAAKVKPKRAKKSKSKAARSKPRGLR